MNNITLRISGMTCEQCARTIEDTLQKSGVGDLTLLGRYTAYQYDTLGRTLRIAPFLGVKMPTGEDNARDGSGRLPPPVQPGSGSWDALGGAVVTYQTLDFEIDGQVSYKANREANGFQAGNVAELDASLQYRLWPGSLGSGVPAFLYGVVEANLIHSAKDDSGGIADPNSGGHHTVSVSWRAIRHQKMDRRGWRSNSCRAEPQRHRAEE